MNDHHEAASPLALQDQLWRDMGFGRTKLRIVYGVLALLVVANIAQGVDRWLMGRQAQTQAYIVVTDSSGHVAQIQRANARWEPGDGVWINEAINWVRNLRARPLDPDASRWQAAEVRNSTVQELWVPLNTWMVETRDELRGRAVEFDLREATMVQRSARSATVLVRWQERKRGAQGGSGAWTGFSATITMGMQPPATPKQVQDNPLGIYITDYSFVEESA